MSKLGRPPRTPVSQRPIWAQRLIKARNDYGLSQADFAAKFGISQSTLADYETGDVQPKISTLNRIATSLGISFETLVGRPDEARRAESNSEKLWKTRARSGEWTDSGALDPHFEAVTERLFQELSAKRVPLRPVFFANFCRLIWSGILALPPEMPFAARIDLMVTHALLQEEWFEKLRLEPPDESSESLPPSER